MDDKVFKMRFDPEETLKKFFLTTKETNKIRCPDG